MSAGEMTPRRGRRPLSMWVVLAGFLFTALYGFTRMIASIVGWYWLALAGVSPGPLFLVITGAVFGLVSLVVLVWLWRLRPGFRAAGAGAALFFAVLHWADRLLVMNFPDRFHNAAFAAVLTILGLAYVIITLRPWHDLRGIPGRNLGR